MSVSKRFSSQAPPEEAPEVSAEGDDGGAPIEAAPAAATKKMSTIDDKAAKKAGKKEGKGKGAKSKKKDAEKETTEEPDVTRDSMIDQKKPSIRMSVDVKEVIPGESRKISIVVPKKDKKEKKGDDKVEKDGGKGKKGKKGDAKAAKGKKGDTKPVEEEKDEEGEPKVSIVGSMEEPAQTEKKGKKGKKGGAKSVKVAADEDADEEWAKQKVSQSGEGEAPRKSRISYADEEMMREGGKKKSKSISQLDDDDAFRKSKKSSEKGDAEKREKTSKGRKSTESDDLSIFDGMQKDRKKSSAKRGMAVKASRSRKMRKSVGSFDSNLSQQQPGGRRSTYRSSSVYSYGGDSSSSSSTSEASSVNVRKPVPRKKPADKKKKVQTSEEEPGDVEEVEGKKKKGGKKVKKEGAPSSLEQTLSEILRQGSVKEEDKSSSGVDDALAAKKAPKKKGAAKKGPVLTPKELAKLEEEKRIFAEEEEKRLAEEEKVKLIEEKKASVMKDKRDYEEHQWRIQQLEATAAYIREMDTALFNVNKANKDKHEWEEFLVCDGLPKPWMVGQMNTYLHLWDMEIPKVTVEQAVRRANEAILLMDKLQEFIDDPFDESEQKQRDWKWIHLMFRERQNSNLESLTYRLLGDISTRLRRIDIPTSEFRLQTENFSLCMWALVQLPIPTPNPRIPPRPRIRQEWKETRMDVVFPTSLKADFMALRCMYVKYDYLSDSSASFMDPGCPSFYDIELSQQQFEEFCVKMHYKYDNRVIVGPKTPSIEPSEDDMTAEPGHEILYARDEVPPQVPWQKLEPNPSEYALNIEANKIEEAATNMKLTIIEGVLNLRKYTILGGVYNLDLFYQPPQPQGMVSFEIFVTRLELPCCLAEAPFYVKYIPPPPTEPGVRKEPEEIEEEMIRQERELDELIFVTLELPTNIYWMDVPIMCHWEPETRDWSTNDIHDFKHIEEKGYVTFRTGCFGAFAVAIYKYPNLPFQAWEIRPEVDGSMTLQLTAAIIMVEFNVKMHLISLTQLQNVPVTIMAPHIGVYYKLPKLKRIMQECGIDIFPAFDTFFYVEGTCEKHWPMEKQLYYGMAISSVLYNFTWSRWNMTLDYRTIVMQMRVYRFDKPKQLNYSTVLVTPMKSLVVDCTEVSPQFCDTPVEGMKFYADFFQLMKGFSSMAVKTKILEGPHETMKTMALLLIATRFLSFS